MPRGSKTFCSHAFIALLAVRAMPSQGFLGIRVYISNCTGATFIQCLSPQTQQFHNENLLFDFLQTEPAFSASLARKERQDLVLTLRLKRFWELASTSFSSLSPIDFFPFKFPLKSNPLPFISIPTPPPHP